MRRATLPRDLGNDALIFLGFAPVRVKTAAMEYIGQGIRINAIAPATISTPMVQRFQDRWPDWQAETNAGYGIGRIGTVEEVFSQHDACYRLDEREISFFANAI